MLFYGEEQIRQRAVEVKLSIDRKKERKYDITQLNFIASKHIEVIDPQAVPLTFLPLL